MENANYLRGKKQKMRQKRKKDRKKSKREQM